MADCFGCQGRFPKDDFALAKVRKFVAECQRCGAEVPLTPSSHNVTGPGYICSGCHNCVAVSYGTQIFEPCEVLRLAWNPTIRERGEQVDRSLSSEESGNATTTPVVLAQRPECSKGAGLRPAASRCRIFLVLSLAHWTLSLPDFSYATDWPLLRARACAMSYARIIGIQSQFVSIIKAISRSGACPVKYPTVTTVAVIVFSIQLYLASECFLAGCLLTSQNMQPNMNTNAAHSCSMNG